MVNYFNVKIVGFLSQETKLSYKDYIDENLDNYIIFPYPSKLWHLEDIKEPFTGILYFYRYFVLCHAK